MLTIELLNRSFGIASPFATAQIQGHRQLLAIQPSPRVRFDGRLVAEGTGPRSTTAVFSGTNNAGDSDSKIYAHKAGVNALTIDRFEGRYLVTGGADGAISMWDLEAADEVRGGRFPGGAVLHKPLGSVAKTGSSHKNGVTAVSFFPFDSLAFTSSSYDHTLKVYSSETLAPTASFDLTSVIYSHALSPIGNHMMVACATQHPAVRLVDLRTGAMAHSLAGHSAGAVLSVAWSSIDEYILASGGVDGTVRFWDIRRSAGMLSQLDMEDSIGITESGHPRYNTQRRTAGRAHASAVNGVLWTNDGRHVVTTGHDERIRVWDTHTGANTLANFGPIVRNRHLSTLLPAVSPIGLVPSSDQVLFYPNEGEILMYELLEGKLLKRLKAPSHLTASQSSGAAQRNVKNRVTALSWRAHSIELISAHGDGSVRSWRPRTRIDAFVDEEELAEEEDSETEAGQRKRKRQVLEDIYKDLTAPKVTFTSTKTSSN